MVGGNSEDLQKKEKLLVDQAAAIRSLMEQALDRFFGEQAYASRTGIYAPENLHRALELKDKISPSIEEMERARFKSNFEPRFKMMKMLCEHFEKELKEIKNIIDPDTRVALYEKKVAAMLASPQVLGQNFTTGPGALFSFSEAEKTDIQESAKKMAGYQKELNELRGGMPALGPAKTTEPKVTPQETTLEKLIQQVAKLEGDIRDADQNRYGAQKAVRNVYKDVKSGLFSAFTGKAYLTKEKLLANLKKDFMEIQKNISKKSPLAVINAMEIAIQKMEEGMANNRFQIFPGDKNNVISAMTEMKQEVTRLKQFVSQEVARPTQPGKR